MDRKQGIIHLGRSKSPSRPINRSTASQFRQPPATSRQKQQHQESTLNRSMNIKSPSRVVLVDTVNYSNTSPVFFPPSQKLVQQRPVLRQNFDMQASQKVAIVSNSPFKRVVVSRTLSNHDNSQQIQHQNMAIQRQNQLLRKIKVLQSRIQQVHQQKQSLIVRTHQQTKRVVNDNIILKNKIQQYSNINNKEISELRNQNCSLKNMLKSQSQAVRVDRVERTSKPTLMCEQYKNVSQKDHASLKNAAYFEEQQQTVSILNNSQQQQTKNSKNKQNDSFKQVDISQMNKLQAQNEELSLKIKQQDEQIKKWTTSYKELTQKLQNSQKQKNKLKEQIDSINKQILDHSSIIEENNKNIVCNYQKKIKVISEELDQTKAQLTHVLGEYEGVKQQMEAYVRKMFQADQQNSKKQAQWMEQVINSSHLAEQMKGKYQQAVKKIDQLEQTIKHIKQNETTSKTESLPPNIQQQTKKEECKKCKQLIKTLLKLNQKVYSRTT